MGYYMGDYYAGDPGFLSVLGKIGRAAVGFIPGVGKPLSMALGAIGRGRRALPAATSAIVRRIPAPIVAGGAAAGRMIARHPVLTAAGAAGALGVASRMGAPAAAGMAHPGLAMGGGFRRRRRMRVTNPKALRRAIRRAEGFKRLALRVLAFTGPRKHRGRAYFKPRKRKRAP